MTNHIKNVNASLLWKIKCIADYKMAKLLDRYNSIAFCISIVQQCAREKLYWS